MERRSEYSPEVIAGFAGRFIEHLLAELPEQDVQQFVFDRLLGEVDGYNSRLVAVDIHQVLREGRIAITVTPPTGRVTVRTEGGW